MTGFFQRFVPGYALIASPLTDLTKRDIPFAWKTEQQQAFETLRDKLILKPVLEVFSSRATKTELHCDASKDGLGAMLFQEDGNGKMKLVYALSSRTSEVESRYHSSRLELRAIIWAIKRLR